MTTEIPNIPIDEIDDPTSIDLTDTENTYPLLEDLVVGDSVGPEAANRQPRALDLRTEALRELCNEVVAAVNALNTNLLHRDGADAVVGGSPSPSSMRGNLSMTDASTSTAYRVTNTADGTADTDAVTKSQLDTLAAFLSTLDGSLTDFVRRDGTLAMQANLNMGGNQAVSVGAPVNSQDAVNKSYADGHFTALEIGYVARDGSVAMTGSLDMGGNKVINHYQGTPSSDGDAVSRAYLLQVISDIAETPPGTIVPYAGNAAAAPPAGWLVCDGSTVSQTTYANLYAVISTTYNTGGEPGGEFRLPDFRGRIPFGLDNMGGTSANRVTDSQADTLGGVLGTEDVTLTLSTMPSHSHSYDDNYISGATGGSLLGPSATGSTSDYDQISPTPSTGSTGGGSAHSNLQPCMAMYVLIKF